MGDGFRRREAALYDGFVDRSFQDRDAAFILFAIPAGVYLTNVLYDFHLRRNDCKLPARLPPHHMQIPTAFGADLLLRRKIVFHHFHRQILRQLLVDKPLPLAVMTLDFYEFRLRYIRVRRGLRLVEQAELVVLAFSLEASNRRCFSNRNCPS